MDEGLRDCCIDMGIRKRIIRRDFLDPLELLRYIQAGYLRIVQNLAFSDVSTKDKHPTNGATV